MIFSETTCRRRILNAAAFGLFEDERREETDIGHERSADNRQDERYQ